MTSFQAYVILCGTLTSMGQECYEGPLSHHYLTENPWHYRR